VSDKGSAGDFLSEGRELFVAAGLLAIERGRATSGNDISFAGLRKVPQSIYVVVNADDSKTLAPLIRLFFGELIATLRATLPEPETEPWPVMVMLDEFDQLGPTPIVEQALKQLAGHGARVSIVALRGDPATLHRASVVAKSRICLSARTPTPKLMRWMPLGRISSRHNEPR
jgi:Type IV secretory system Conjugative DNA transfer